MPQGGQDQLGLGVVDAHGQLSGGEAAEHHRVDGAEAGAGQHRHHRFGNHRHVDDDPIAALDPEAGEHAGEAGDLALQLGIADAADGVGHRAVIDDRGLVAAALLDMAIDGVVAGVELAAGEPAVERRPAVVEHRVPRLRPVNVGGGLGPEGLRVVAPGAVDLVVATRHLRPPLPAPPALRAARSPTAMKQTRVATCQGGPRAGPASRLIAVSPFA